MIDTVLTATSAIWQLTDEYALALTEAHRSTTADLLVERQQRRSALAEALFTGEPGPESWPWEVSALLGLPADGDLVVVAADTVRPAQEGLPNIENRLAEHGFTSIWQLTPARQRGIVALSGGTVDTLVTILREVARTRTGVSPAFRSLRETPRALHLAGVAAAAGAAGAVTTLSASPLAGLVAEHPDESWRVAREVLGRVLELPPDDRTALLATAQAWFDHGGSAERAGEALYCHPNTVRYRLRRLQELTGRALTEPWAVAELAAALQSYMLQRARLERPTPGAQGAGRSFL
jgi:DNA-binding PucR family transcriptional regulator